LLLDLHHQTNGKNNTTANEVVKTSQMESCSDKTSGKKFADKGVDSDEVRVMQKVLANEVSLEKQECVGILNQTEWDVHRGIKCIRLREALKQHCIPIDMDYNWIHTLKKYNWNVRQASNYLIATQGSSEGSTEV